MQNEHGGESQQPEPGSPWSATGSEHDGSDAASSAGRGAAPGPGGWDDLAQRAPAADAPGNGNVTIPFTPGSQGQPGPYGFGSPSGPARGPAGDYGYGQAHPGFGYGQGRPPADGYGTGGYGQPGGYGQAGGPGQPGAYSQPGQDGQPGAYSQAGQPGQPGAYSQPGQGGAYSQAGQGGAYSQGGQAGQGGGYGPAGPPPGGYGQPGGYGPPGGGYGQAGGGYGPGGYQPPGGYGMPGDYLQQPPPPRRRMTGLVAYIAVAAVAAAAGAGTVLLADTASHSNAQPPAAGQPANPFGGGGGQPSTNPFCGGSNQAPSGNPAVSASTLQSVKAAVSPGIVDITSSLTYQGGTAAATGMIISKSGLVLTNNHVIEGTTGLTARVVATGQRYTAKFLGYNKGDDVAVIQLENASGLKTVPLGNSSTVKVGDGVIALGNAGGTGGTTVVSGAITGLNQSITASDDGSAASERLTNMLRTDANIVPGDSGGPLASTAGKVIGMDTAAATGSFNNGQPSEVGFAIPINRALNIARQIIAGDSSGSVTIGSTGFLGVLVPAGKASQVSDPAQQRSLQIAADEAGDGGVAPPRSGLNCLPNNQDSGIPGQVAAASSGALVLGALCGTPSAAAGLVPGDVITSVGGHAVTTPASLTGIMAGLRSGTKVSVTWETLSGGSETKPLTLLPAPPQ
ncbi:MAG TPA: trypsin-like peptidase domain-containing protein [Streptosporangiaceae bacterium]|nr:trypsin-like peptidase domain-containing protein [Streptosporangiaceae bacterium]